MVVIYMKNQDLAQNRTESGPWAKSLEPRDPTLRPGPWGLDQGPDLGPRILGLDLEPGPGPDLGALGFGVRPGTRPWDPGP